MTPMSMPFMLDVFITAADRPPLPCVIFSRTDQTVCLTWYDDNESESLVLDHSSSLHEFLSLVTGRMDSRARCTWNSEKARMTSIS